MREVTIPGRQPIRHSQQGRGRFTTVLTVLVLAFAVFAAIKIIPAYVLNYELQDSMQTEARFAISSKKTEDDVRDSVWKRIQELGIPARKEDIRVNMVENNVTIVVNYVVHVDLKVYEFNLEFHPHADNHTI